MPWFSRRTSDTGEDPDAEESIRSLQAGGLPVRAVRRLQEQAERQGTDAHIFTSNLSVNEMLVARQLGYEPLGQVMGSTVYHVGFQWMPTYSMMSGELEVITTAYHNARDLALGRLAQEASLLGASGVVGVRLERRSYDWATNLLEFCAVGTAVKEADAPGGHPFTGALSGQELWQLRQAGYKPISIAIGNCTWYQVANWRTQTVTSNVFGGAWANQELTDFTQAVYSARSIAVGRMEAVARAAGGVGVVGVDVDMDVEPVEVGDDSNHRRDLLIHFTATGTAIYPESGRWPVFSLEPTVTLAGAQPAELERMDS